MGVSAAARHRALALYRQGNGHFERSRYVQALAAYKRAILSWDHPAIRFNMAVCLINLDRPLEAYENLKKAVRFGPAPLGEVHFRQARTYERLLQGRLGRLAVGCDEPSARVTLDGRLLLTCPGRVERVLPVGKHVLVGSKRGFLTETRTVLVQPGGRLSVRVGLVPLGKALGLRRRFRRWIPWTVFGAGVALAAVGVPLVLRARSRWDDYNAGVVADCSQGCPPGIVTSRTRDAERDARAMDAGGYVAFALGGAVTATGVILLILNRPRPVRRRAADGRRLRESASSMPSVFPLVGPGVLGGVARVQF